MRHFPLSVPQGCPMSIHSESLKTSPMTHSCSRPTLGYQLRSLHTFWYCELQVSDILHVGGIAIKQTQYIHKKCPVISTREQTTYS